MREFTSVDIPQEIIPDSDEEEDSTDSEAEDRWTGFHQDAMEDEEDMEIEDFEEMEFDPRGRGVT